MKKIEKKVLEKPEKCSNNGWNSKPVGVESEPGEIEGNLFAKVVSNFLDGHRSVERTLGPCLSKFVFCFVLVVGKDFINEVVFYKLNH